MVNYNLKNITIYCKNQRESRLTWFALYRMGFPMHVDFNVDNLNYIEHDNKEVYWELINIWNGTSKPSELLWDYSNYQTNKNNQIINFQELQQIYTINQREKKLNRILKKI